MYILELCCGWKSVTDVFVSEHGWDSTTVDILRKFKPTILDDITKWDYRSYYRAHPPPDVIWASPHRCPYTAMLDTRAHTIGRRKWSQLRKT